MSEIKLNMRYPESRPEDITDAYMRGVEVGRAMMMDENAKLRELVRELLTDPDAWDYDYSKYRMRELGVEV